MDSESTNRFAPWMVRLVALWLLTGAFFKLFVGTPNDLPPVVRSLPLEAGLTYNLAISIELSLGFCALVKPSWAWFLLCGVLLTFDGVLITQLAAGDANCGCFGSKITMPPWLMLTIDSVLLCGLVISRPWRGMPRGLPVSVPILTIAIGLAMPWFLDRQITTGEITSDGETLGASNAWILLDIEDWIGREIFDTPLAEAPLSDHIDVDSLLPEGLWVFWRQTCDHCAEHLAQLAVQEVGERIVTLIQLREPFDTEGNRVVHLLPTGGFVQSVALPESIQYVIQTPAEMLLENGKIVGAKEATSPDDPVQRTR